MNERTGKQKFNKPSSIFNRSLLSIILFFLLISLFWKPLLIFVIPGILVIFIPILKKIEFFELLTYIIGFSMAFWISSFWFLKYIPISLTNFFIFTLAATILIIIYFFILKNANTKRGISVLSRDIFLVGIFLFIIYLRLMPFFRLITPSGADMSMHTYITELIIKANGVPHNYYPILQIDRFDSFPVGFHTISALISILGDMPSYRSTFLLSCLTYVFFSLFIFIFLKRYIRWEFAFLSSIAISFFTLNPQGFAFWGGNPSIFALDFLILLIIFLDMIHYSKWFILFSGLAMASIFLTHTLIFVQSAYIFGISFFIYVILNKEYKNFKWTNYFLIILIFIFLSSPYLISIDKGITTTKTLDWIRNWVRNTSHVWHGSIHNFVWTIPLYIKSYVGISLYAIPFCLIGYILLFFMNRTIFYQYSAYLILCVLLILNAQYWILPFSYAIYPERVAVMAVIPLSLFFAITIESSFLLFKKGFNKKISLMMMVLMFLVFMILAIYSGRNFSGMISSANSVSKEDFDAMMWIRNNTSPDAIIKNNYGDSGLWIPAISFRTITNPHINVVYLYKMKYINDWEYVYIGTKCIYKDSCLLKTHNLEIDPNYGRVYSKGGVFIYKTIK